MALGMLERGEVHLTTLLLLRERLTEDNHEDLLRAAIGKTKAQVQEFLALRFPRSDTPSVIRSLPNATVPPTAGTTPGFVPMPAPKATRIEPLSPDRYEVRFTATRELKEKLEYATDLMRHANPKGDLSIIVERALDLLVGELEKRRLGKAKRPPLREHDTTTRSGYVRRAVRREVFERDGARCAFMDELGRRCESRVFLELDHVNAHALGGSDDATNLIVKCAAHNRLAAERDFGREHIDKRKAERTNLPRQRRSQSKEATRALTSLGFKQPHVRRALAVLEERWAGSDPSLETILRETLSILT
ncbi:hypothetical protein LZC95_38305 [Pendulispora brunnea]|uniref:HNH nuclease domain-containing protein n=1 Tax=Pendulispora brunnea TaxID=2905690 RepID=A0ABZ2K0M9_9BACT